MGDVCGRCFDKNLGGIIQFGRRLACLPITQMLYMMHALSLFPNFDPLTSHFRVTCRPFRSLSPSHSFILLNPCPGRLSLFFSMTYFLFLILSFLSAARAANDWNTPCLSGVCSYDLPTTNGSAASGSMKIWGSKTAIGDITEAAGWKILGCAPDALTQDIRLVCVGDASACQHLYEGHGAADTIVRLPESCGKGPFARVQKAWVPADQSIPASIAARIARRDGTTPQVQAITLDTNFAAANNSKTGSVNLAIMGVNVPGLNDALDSDAVLAAQRRSRLGERGITNFVSNAAKSISNAISGVNTVNINKSKALPAADFSKKVSLFETSLECPPISAEASIGLDATAHAVVTVGVAASGTIVPPKITAFNLLASLTADLNGELTLKAELSGKLDSGNKLLFEAGIPGLDFPGILTLGPSFQVNARGIATAELAADLTLGINYHVNGAKLSFPTGSQSAGTVSLGDTPLTLSADTKVEATTTIEAHLIPSINFGLSALDDVAKANVALSLDASATMVLKVEAKAGASATINKASRKRQDDFEDGEDTTDSSDDDFSSDGDVDSTDASDDSTDASTDDGDSSDDSSNGSDSSNDDFGDSSDDSTDDLDSSGDDEDVDSADSSDDSTDDLDSSGDSDQQDESTSDADDQTDSDLEDDSDSSDDADVDDENNDQSVDDATADDTDFSGDSDDQEADTTSDSSDEADTDLPGDEAPAGDNTDSDSADSDSDDNADAVSADNTDSDSADSDSDSDDNADAVSADNSTSTDTGDAADSDDSTATTTSLPTATSLAATPEVSVTKTAEASFGGSVVISGGLDLSASATGTFFGLFDASKKLSIFKKTFPLFSKSFGSEGKAERRSLPARPFSTRRASRAQRFALYNRALTCLKEGGESEAVASETIPGKSL
ncbi:hypothetical protein DFH08DRAFT_306238 [Mycena albidolilacea]|uniref:Uncharacterized protein n=1 Tax=Mycena albidolilacea TaxID=1033008 RepID=A0AAD6ZPH9_9AGAR|nr:hypothetical protein DFH08DRAFT_306238 [Mycena albidolilacea]